MAERQAFAVCVKHVDSGSFFCDVAKIFESPKQEYVKIVLAHAVVLYFVVCPGSVFLIAALQAFVFGFIVYVIRRIRDYKIGGSSRHQFLNVSRIRGVSDHQPVLAQLPDVSGHRDRLGLFNFLKGFVYVVVVIVCLRLKVHGSEELRKIMCIEAGGGRVVAAAFKPD